tara:strand:- start:535 stop:699 length:165 start_codon:yes stop_codon:yes gene_type:complete
MNIEIFFHLNSLFFKELTPYRTIKQYKKKLFLLKKNLKFLKKHIDSWLKKQAKF